VYLNTIIYPILVTIIKCSTICLYLRIFRTNEAFAIAAHTVAGLVIAWRAATMLVAIFECSPIEAYWKTDIPRNYSIDLQSYLLGTNIVNNLLDFAVLILPVPMVWKMLNLSIKRKAAVTAIFLIGIL